MKKQILSSLLMLSLSACGTGDYIHSKEPRSSVYYGQPVADLYENFGTPTKATRLSDNERVLIYISQEIEKDWAYRYVRGCVMKFHLLNERVVSWTADGQACVIQSQSAKDMPAAAQSMQNDLGLLDSRNTVSDQTVASGTGGAGGVLPVDAFDGKASNSYTPIRSITSSEGLADRGKASASTSISGQLPADAFDGKASTTYSNVPGAGYKTYASPVQASGMAQVPADAFQGAAPVTYIPQTAAAYAPQNTGAYASQPVIGQVNPSLGPTAAKLPADAFDGRASTVVKPRSNSIQSQQMPVQMPQTTTAHSTSSFWDQNDDEWGLFD